jgi:predicted MFS family arabinose efflux permease
VLAARLRFPYAGDIGRSRDDAPAAHPPSVFWWYAAASALVAFGFCDYALIAFHYAREHVLADTAIPIVYAFAMLGGGAGALLFGKLYDRFGVIVLVPVTLATALFAPLVFLGDAHAAIAGALLWGVGLGVHESVMAAAVADMIPASRRASAYGIFTAIFGVAWLAGSVIEGWLYDLSIAGLVVLALAAQLAALVPLTRTVLLMRPK